MTLLQDEAPEFEKHEPKDHTLSRALAGKPDAMLHAREAAAAIAKERSLTRRLWEPWRSCKS